MSLEPLLHASPLIKLHALAAMASLLLGAVQLWRTKGDRLHRALGRVWVSLMAVVALSSFFIWTIRLWGPFSPIHLLSLFVLIMLWRGVGLARRGNIAAHRRIMQGTYIFGLVITGLLTFIPGRTMYFVAFGPQGATPLKLAAFAALVVAAAAAGLYAARGAKPAG
ncbi:MULTISPECIES: DUF2306 domain-containing protein [unclassified Mesorhizobium]|uniref:DUF2306 domain-containing protein n=1 Tax=unclassified Mesorhizobium TaxID=325217 RepID=UPI000F74C407|nr:MULTISPECIES: DUF2306 domain-containing protein [unclassified Mesorhizobium]AZO53695.1 DUF2306 domain-containing protein [Mesorhizobium sp. M8A.F.Ca.ET.057.01.1.1]RWE46101.1 MAG: DUF2306 domain-containing protein [Mesorhizobium sp.]